MGSGKSTIGALLAEQLGYHFIDTDALIEKQEGQSVAEIFRDKGAAHFRKLEKALVDELPSENAVIACGGGLPCFGDLLLTIKKKGVVVYLKANPDNLYDRINTDTKRPLLLDLEDFRALFDSREACYENADVVVSAEASLNDVLVNILLETNSKIKEERWNVLGFECGRVVAIC